MRDSIGVDHHGAEVGEDGGHRRLPRTDAAGESDEYSHDAAL
jgi:hypothetical protein